MAASQTSEGLQPDTDSLLQITSYTRQDHEVPVASVHPSQHDAVRSSVFQTLSLAPTFDLGHLNRLPFELLSLICLSLDVSSAFRLSHVNRTAREILAFIREYRQLAAHGLESVCVLLRTGLASHVDITSLYAVLTTPNCSLCPSFGGFVFLPTASRCCLGCIASSPVLQVGYLGKLAEAAGQTVAELEEDLPILHTLPGRRRSVVAVQHALDLLCEKGVEDEDAKKAVGRWPDSATLRFQATTRLPWVDRRTGEAQAGLSCRGCKRAADGESSDEKLELRDRLYSREGFIRHVEECEAARKLWDESQEGKGAGPLPLA